MAAQPTFGSIPSEPDYRDAYAAASALPALPEAQAPFLYDLSKIPVLDQNKIPACVSHAAVTLLQAYWYAKTGVVVPFSPRFLDIRTNRTQFGLNDGRYPRDAMRIMAKEGCATTKTVPSDTAGMTVAQYRNAAAITPAAMADAAPYKIPGYVNLPIGTDSMRRAVRLYGPLSILVRIGEEWWTPSWSKADINPLRTPKTIVSGHEIVMHGNGSTALNRIRNSWSTAWNDGGEGDYDPVKWAPYVNEAWAIAKIPDDVAAFLANLPSPADFKYQWNTDISYGQYSDDVKFAQIALMILGLLETVPAQQLGYYGPKTRTAVGNYQRIKGIPAADRNPERIGPKTRGFLNADFAI